MAKPYIIRRLEPTGIILGSSRAQFGFDPSHPGWNGENIYNYSIRTARKHNIYCSWNTHKFKEYWNPDISGYNTKFILTPERSIDFVTSYNGNINTIDTSGLYNLFIDKYLINGIRYLLKRPCLYLSICFF